jgi:hypothetical protein
LRIQIIGLLSVGAFRVFYLKEASTVSFGQKAIVVAQSADRAARLDRRSPLHSHDRSNRADFR